MSKATARARHGSYLFQRPGSSNWYVRLRSPEKTVVKSLGTADKAQAEITALRGFPLDDGTIVSIATHKAALLAARPVIESTWQHKLEPGREHVAPEGGKIVATNKELIHIGHNGAILTIEPNGGPAFQLVSRDKLAVPALAQAFIEADFGAGRGERPKVPIKNGDDAIVETYLEHRRIGGYNASEARAVWQLYKQLTDSKPLKDADRDDGRKLVKHFMDKKLKSATIEKKIAWLNAAVNLAIKESKLKFNPFAGIIPRLDDAERRLPLDDADMKAIRANLKLLDKSDQLLLRILATTGMRLAEAFGIDSEQTERRCRFVIVGTKTEQSQRRVPLPAAVLPFVPGVIKGKLFAGTDDAASKRLNRFLDDIGITDARKVIHSLRHRAQDRLRAAGCPEDVRWEILGHEKETVAAGYGEGSPVPLLRKWIGKIGC
jgi:integrase